MNAMAMETIEMLEEASALMFRTLRGNAQPSDPRRAGAIEYDSWGADSPGAIEYDSWSARVR
jgi:hypothetical protein